MKDNTLRGGVLENIYLRGFTGRTLERDVVVVNMKYNDQERPRQAVARNIWLHDFTRAGATSVLILDGAPNATISGVHLSKSTYTDIAGGDKLNDATDVIRDQDVTVNGKPTQ